MLNKYIDTTVQSPFPKNITGLIGPLDEQIVAIDIRPLNNVLYAISKDNLNIIRLYTIDAETSPLIAQATFIGNIRDSNGDDLILNFFLKSCRRGSDSAKSVAFPCENMINFDLLSEGKWSIGIVSPLELLIYSG